MSVSLEKKLAAWKPLKAGHRVASKTYHRGVTGTVVDVPKPGTRMDGFAYYGVRMDDDTNNVTDFVRWELKKVPKNSAPVKTPTTPRVPDNL